LIDLGLLEVGPTLVGANSDTGKYPVIVKSVQELVEFAASHGHEFAEFLVKAGGWDGAAAMAKCKDAGDFRSIAFERANDSDPDTAAHWALPHHDGPGQSANPKGVSAALGSLNGSRGGAPSLKDSGAARSHLEKHEAGFGNKDVSEAVNEGDAGLAVEPDYTDKRKAVLDMLGVKAGSRNSAVDQAVIQHIHDMLSVVGAKCDFVFDGKSRKSKDAELTGDEAGDEAAHPEHDAMPEKPQGGHMKTDDTDVKAPETDEDDVEKKDEDGEAETKDLDAIDTDGVSSDGDQGEPADPEEEEKPHAAQKAGDEEDNERDAPSASGDGRTDAPSADPSGKAEEPDEDQAKAEDQEAERKAAEEADIRMKAELLALQAFLANTKGS
jgi:hypothetical protein